uniref:TACO1/YebC-like second and third domain-containing protein n=1 Tax=Glossina pallidipes TaxID=7398 RepID=A0A1A9ZXV5_GLOPL
MKFLMTTPASTSSKTKDRAKTNLVTKFNVLMQNELGKLKKSVPLYGEETKMTKSKRLKKWQTDTERGVFVDDLTDDYPEDTFGASNEKYLVDLPVHNDYGRNRGKKFRQSRSALIFENNSSNGAARTTIRKDRNKCLVPSMSKTADSEDSLILTSRSRNTVTKMKNENKPSCSIKTKSGAQLLNRDKTTFEVPTKNSNFKNQVSLPPAVPEATDEVRLAHRLRLAIQEGRSKNIRENEQLRTVVLRALDQHIPWPTIEAMLQDCGSPQRITTNCFILQIRFQGKVDLICSVRTKNIMAFKRKILSILKSHGAIFSSVMHNFSHCCVVEALASYRTPIQFSDFERTLAKDAMECHATSVEIVDYETGAVNLKCHPMQLPDVSIALEQRNYKIISTDYGFRPRERVQLDQKEHRRYNRLLSNLRKYPEIECIYDNLNPVDLQSPEPSKDVSNGGVYAHVSEKATLTSTLF